MRIQCAELAYLYMFQFAANCPISILGVIFVTCFTNCLYQLRLLHIYQLKYACILNLLHAACIICSLNSCAPRSLQMNSLNWATNRARVLKFGVYVCECLTEVNIIKVCKYALYFTNKSSISFILGKIFLRICWKFEKIEVHYLCQILINFMGYLLVHQAHTRVYIVYRVTGQ